jgi:tetrahydromethanopterin S-methyltransferase subunit F
VSAVAPAAPASDKPKPPPAFGVRLAPGVPKPVPGPDGVLRVPKPTAKNALSQKLEPRRFGKRRATATGPVAPPAKATRTSAHQTAPAPGRSAGGAPAAEPGGKRLSATAQARANFEKLSPEQRKDWTAVAKRAMGFTGLVFAGLIVTMLPLPWPALAFALLIWALILGARTMPRARKLPEGRRTVNSLIIGMAVAVLLLGYTGLMAVQWPAQWELQRCQSTALTQAGQDKCTAQYNQHTVDLLNKLQKSAAH